MVRLNFMPLLLGTLKKQVVCYCLHRLTGNYAFKSGIQNPFLNFFIKIFIQAYRIPWAWPPLFAFFLPIYETSSVCPRDILEFKMVIFKIRSILCHFIEPRFPVRWCQWLALPLFCRGLPRLHKHQGTWRHALRPCFLTCMYSLVKDQQDTRLVSLQLNSWNHSIFS